GELAVADPLDVLVGEAGGAGQAARRRAVAVPHRPLGAVGVGLDVPDPLAVLLRGEVEHPGGRLEDVPVGVDVAECARVRRGHGSPRSLRALPPPEGPLSRPGRTAEASTGPAGPARPPRAGP